MAPKGHLEGLVVCLVLEGGKDLFQVHLMSEDAYLYSHLISRQMAYVPFTTRYTFCRAL